MGSKNTKTKEETTNKNCRTRIFRYTGRLDLPGEKGLLDSHGPLLRKVDPTILKVALGRPWQRNPLVGSSSSGLTNSGPKKQHMFCRLFSIFCKIPKITQKNNNKKTCSFCSLLKQPLTTGFLQICGIVWAHSLIWNHQRLDPPLRALLGLLN